VFRHQITSDNSIIRSVGRHQRMVRRRNPHTKQKGAGTRHVENGGEDGIGHLRALSPLEQWMDGCAQYGLDDDIGPIWFLLL